MNIALFDNLGNYSIVSGANDLVDEIRSCIIKNPKIVDGMGDRIVICNCSVCKGSGLANFAEIIVLEYENEFGETVCKNFSGDESYSLQSALHEFDIIK